MYTSFAAAVFSTACCEFSDFQGPPLLMAFPYHVQDKNAVKCKNARMGAAVSSL
jgi:hypothetical protein